MNENVSRSVEQTHSASSWVLMVTRPSQRGAAFGVADDFELEQRTIQGLNSNLESSSKEHGSASRRS
jgi:hypothetical protein